MKNIIVILGPTGVGKTKASVELAKKIDGEVINADSVQIYKKLNIGSSKTTKKEMDGIRHYLFDIKEPNEFYTIYDYQQDVRSLISKIEKRGKKVIIVGGTGLYIKAALYDYRLSKENKKVDLSSYTNEEIYNMIKKINVESFVDINNRVRLERCYNRLINNNNSYIGKDNLLYDVDLIGLTTQRDNLYNIINKRVDKMFDDGLVDEVNNLKPYYKKSHVLNSAIGYKEFIPYFNNEIDLDDVKENIKKNSRHFAKRQYTFFNNQFDGIKWFNINYLDFTKTIDKVYNYINRSGDK